MSLEPGSRLGAYEVIGPIGAGGMGEVYKARDEALGRDVAIKVLPPSFAEDADRVARFEREARTLAALNHPNIAQIYGIESGSGSPGVQESAGTRALVMEFVDGDDLSVRIAQGAIPLEDALPMARQIADALEVAHEQGIIHRDLKPANIKVKADGTVKVLDFGLAKAMDSGTSGPQDPSNSPTLTARATQMGMVIGTAAYMAPEQAKGKTVDKRADIWAFGVVLYEMLTGKRGYEADDISDTLAAVLTREVDYSELPEGTPPRLNALLHDCLVRDPKQRLRDMGEARRVLDQLITGNSGSTIMAAVASSGDMPAAVPVPAWRQRLPWAIAMVAVAAAAAMAWVSFRTPAEAPAIVTRAKFTSDTLAAFVSLSRDGTQLAYTSALDQGFQLVLRQMDQFEGQPLPGTDGGVFSVFSPGGDWLAYSTLEGKIKKVPITGGTPITLCDGTFQSGAAWGGDDTIVFGGGTGLMRVSANGGTPEALTTVDTDNGESQHSRPQFLPGGLTLLFTVTSKSPDSPQFAVLDLETKTYQTVARGGDNGRYVPTGHLTFVRGNTLFATPFDLAQLAVTGTEAPVVEDISTTGSPNTGDYAFSATGLLAYAEALGGSGTVMMWADRKGEIQPLPGQVPRQWGTGSLSPNGRLVANSIDAESGDDIWVMDLARGTPQRLTFGGNNTTPIWTPDNRHVVYTSDRDGKPGLYSVAADGSGTPELVLADEGSVIPHGFTPDGSTLLYSRVTDGRRRVMVLPPAGADGTRQPRPLRESAGNDLDATVSPDGHWVVLTSNESSQLEVYVLPFPGPGPKIQVSFGGGQRPRWASTGRELFYWSGTANSTDLMSVPIQRSPTFSVGAPVRLFEHLAGTTWGVAPDAQHFLIEDIPGSNGGSTIATVTNWFDELQRRAPAKK